MGWNYTRYVSCPRCCRRFTEKAFERHQLYQRCDAQARGAFSHGLGAGILPQNPVGDFAGASYGARLDQVECVLQQLQSSMGIIGSRGASAFSMGPAVLGHDSLSAKADNALAMMRDMVAYLSEHV